MFIRLLRPIFNALRSFTPVLGRLLCVGLISVSFTQAKTVLVHGDSLSAGYGMAPEQTWVALLQSELGSDFTVVNSSISGETSRGGLERLPALLSEHEPDVVVLELGANDGLRGYPLNQMRKNLAAMVQLSKEAGAEVAIIGIRLPPNLGKRYTEPFFNSYEMLANETNTAYLPFLLDGVAQYGDLMQRDGLHPTAEAQPRILKNVMPVLAPLLN